MPESGTYGSVRGAAGNSRPYRECRPIATVREGRRPKAFTSQDIGCTEDAVTQPSPVGCRIDVAGRASGYFIAACK